jgi:hypothetical protein
MSLDPTNAANSQDPMSINFCNSPSVQLQPMPGRRRYFKGLTGLDWMSQSVRGVNLAGPPSTACICKRKYLEGTVGICGRRQISGSDGAPH